MKKSRDDFLKEHRALKSHVHDMNKKQKHSTFIFGVSRIFGFLKRTSKTN